MTETDIYTAIDNKRSLTNLSNSILKGFGAEPFHEDIPEVTDLIRKHRRVALFLFDGLGRHILETHKRASKKLLEHKLADIHSVNPATTAAATVALLTAKFPIETGWLGWSIPLREYGGNIDVFPNLMSATGKPCETPDAMRKACPIVTIDQILKEHGVRAKLSYNAPIEKGSYTDLKGVMDAADRYFKEGDGFGYFYYDEPDHTIHVNGVKSKKVRKFVKRISKAVDKFAKDHPDILVMMVADHGLIDVVYRDLSAHPELHEKFREPASIEGRMQALYVKEGEGEAFESLFHEHFGDHFMLFKSSELIEKGYFGVGEEHPRAREFLGDYLAIPKGDCIFTDSSYGPDKHLHKAHHAGPLPGEKDIVLVAYNR